MERRVPLVAFDVVLWDDGTFEFAWRDLSSFGGVGVNYERYGSPQDLAAAMGRIAAERVQARGDQFSVGGRDVSPR